MTRQILPASGTQSMSVPRNTSLRYPGGRRAAYAAVAYLAGFLAILVGFAGRYRAVLDRTVVDTRADGTPIDAVEAGAPLPVPDWAAASVFHYNAHLVTVDVPLQTIGQVASLNLVLEAGGAFLALFALPPLLLAVAGAAVVRDAAEPVELRFDFGAAATTRYAVNGGLVTMLGYLPLALLGIAIPSVAAGVNPNPILAWVVAGMAYPLVFGGLGGAAVRLAGLHPEPESDRESRRETGRYGSPSED